MIPENSLSQNKTSKGEEDFQFYDRHNDKLPSVAVSSFWDSSGASDWSSAFSVPESQFCFIWLPTTYGLVNYVKCETSETG